MDLEIKSELEKIEISDNSFLKVYLNNNENIYVLEINYLNGKFIAEKKFSKNLDGVASMEEIKDLYRSESDVKRYFGIL
tara:strand:+ start:7310 stop:7546 length:237 start_codon:yes stop_codon:yes gene_type:complete